MSMEKGAKPWMYVVGAATALVAGAIFFNYITNKSSSSTVNLLCEEIDSLGPPKKETNGLLSFSYFKDIFTLVSKHSKAKFADEKKEILRNRRRALKNDSL